MNNGPVIIVDDDEDDKEFVLQAWKELEYPNPLIFFSEAQPVLDYLKSEKTVPFLILCDVNLRGTDGFELKEKLLADASANYRSIPFVFWSNHASQKQIQKSYDLGGNGFFIKASTHQEIKKSLADITEYWLNSKTPF